MKRHLIHLLVASWFFTNTIFLLSSSLSLFSLNFVSAIPLTQYLILWGILFLLLLGLQFLPFRRQAAKLAPVVGFCIYAVALVVKEVVII